MKKIFPLLAGVAILAVGILWFAGVFNSNKNSKPFGQDQNSWKDFDGRVRYNFVDLPGDLLARAGDLTVTRAEVENTAAYKSLKNKEKDLLFVLIYKQFVAYAETPPALLQLNFSKTSIAPDSLLNQFAIPIQRSCKVVFKPSTKTQVLAVLDGSPIKAQDIDYNNFIWASFETEGFQLKLSEIDRNLKRKVILTESKKLGMSAQDYQKKYIFDELPMDISAESVQKYLEKYNLEPNEKNKKSAESVLLRERKQRGIDYIIEKYILKLPIEVALKPPQYHLEEKVEWTPQAGDKTPQVLLTLFSDTRSTQSTPLIKHLFKMLQKYKGLGLEYRPVFPESDQWQALTTEMHFCVLMSEKEKFWSFFEESLGDFAESTEGKLYEKAQHLSIDVAKLKKCLVEKKFKEVVEYHQKYAQYLGITLGPVLYIGGEVLSGAIAPEKVEFIIQRQLQVPEAGSW